MFALLLMYSNSTGCSLVAALDCDQAPQYYLTIHHSSLLISHAMLPEGLKVKASFLSLYRLNP